MMKKKKVLGKGLSALIAKEMPAPSVPGTSSVGGTGTSAASAGLGERLRSVPVNAIAPNRFQPRKSFSEEAIKELTESIREKGVIEPLIVRDIEGSGYELIAGERRLRASIRANLKEVPVIVMNVDDTESLEIAIIENVQREDLNAIEEADSYQALMNFGLTQEEVSRKVGKERATVANYLRLLKLTPEVKDEMLKGNISMGHGKAILSVATISGQRQLCRKIITKGLSVREAEALASGAIDQSKKSGAGKIPHKLTPIEMELMEVFGTKVLLKDRNGKGKVEIQYFSKDERERILDMLRGAS